MTKEELGQRLKEIRVQYKLSYADLWRNGIVLQPAWVEYVELGTKSARADAILDYIAHLGYGLELSHNTTSVILIQYSDFTHWLKEICKQRQLTQCQLSRLSGVAQPVINKTLVGIAIPRVDKMLRIIDSLQFNIVLKQVSNPQISTLSSPHEAMQIAEFGSLLKQCRESRNLEYSTISTVSTLSDSQCIKLESGEGKLLLSHALEYISVMCSVLRLSTNTENVDIHVYADFLQWAIDQRQRRNWTQIKASCNMQVSSTLICNFESGRTTLTLAAFLKVIAAYGATLSIIKK